MPFISVISELTRARAERFAVPLFGAFDGFGVDGIIEAAEEQSAPVIAGPYAGMLERPSGRALAQYVRARAEDSPVPVALMLDHGRSVDECLLAISCGFTDVMYDGSRLPLEGNIVETRRVVAAAHAVGVGVEAELGHIGLGSDYHSFASQREGFTDPDAAERFVAETGVDALAIAVGTAHGLYESAPEIDLDLIAELAARVSIPLVLHGGTGCTDEQFHAAIAAGIAKINIATDLLVTTAARLRELARTGEPGYFDFGKTAVETYRQGCARYLQVLGASGKSRCR
jgi:ketose-bisphosphate aldolase